MSELRDKNASACRGPGLVFGESFENRMASSVSSRYRPYSSRVAQSADVATWVQVDLGASQLIEAVVLYPFVKTHGYPGNGFPARFCIECSNNEDFAERIVLVDNSNADYPRTADRIQAFSIDATSGRYLRMTATRLRLLEQPVVWTRAVRKAWEPLIPQAYLFALSKIEILSGGIDVALGRRVSVDSVYGNPQDAQQLTRPRRPNGEGIKTDNPQNVTSADAWRPVERPCRPPQGGVTLAGGLFQSAMTNSIRYLLSSYSVDDILRPFRERAGKSTHGSKPKESAWSELWEEVLAGSNAGRFLMGAGTTLQWREDRELRARLDAVVEGIAECRQVDGNLMAYSEEQFFDGERGSYERAWLTQGLIQAGYAGNPAAFQLLRDYYDWYNSRPYLPWALRGCTLGATGTVANTQMYFTPLGKPEDLHVVQRYLQEDHWLEDLAARKVDAVWQNPYERPHLYAISFLEPYLDLYRATGDERYFHAVRGAWELLRENWQSVGGSFSIMEWQANIPKSHPLYGNYGETCGSAFWILLNQRLHYLAPDEECYVAEIEKSIYNVLLANQGGNAGIRYHTHLLGYKESPQDVNTCCEGQGTHLIGSLPQFIYSVADDGLYVNLFERSSITWEQSGQRVVMKMETDFPKTPEVKLRMQVPKPFKAKIRIRVPSWSAGAMAIAVNGQQVGLGSPGQYVAADREWAQGDAISFTLPMAFKLTRYAGVDQVQGRERYALEYGPILMAALNAADAEVPLLNAIQAAALLERLMPIADQPLHFSAADMTWIPYYEVENQSFSCVPIIRPTGSVFL